MNWLSLFVTKTTLQYVLNAVGAVIVTKGWLDESTWAQIVGGLLIIIPAILGIKDSATNKVSVAGQVVKLADMDVASQKKVATAVSDTTGKPVPAKTLVP